MPSTVESRAPDLDAEVRIPGTALVALLLIVSTVLTLLGDRRVALAQRDALFNLAVVGYCMSACAWLLNVQRPRFGSWAAIVALTALTFLSIVWLDAREAMMLLAVPPVLAAASIGLAPAAFIAFAETMVLLVIAERNVVALAGSTVIFALTTIWAIVGAVVAAYRPIVQRSHWLERYFDSARGLLEEARSRGAELEQALVDLAHANRQLVLANERVAALRLVAEEAQEAKARFVARVSHEFRTPLNMIIGLVDLMVQAPQMFDVKLSPKMREDLEVVHRNCEHLSRMVNDVLDLTRMESDRLVLHRERVDLRAIIDSATLVVRPLLDNKRLSLQVSIPAGLPEVYCDRTRIEQVVLNLLSNAARYTDQGGISVKVVQENHRLLVSVADTGPGIAPADAERIFEPFCQGTTDLWRDKGGSGLGLAISKQFIELHGGRLWLESELGVGTTFVVDLPTSPPAEHTISSAHQIREEWVWRERRSRFRFPNSHYRPRFAVCDPNGDLSATLTHQTDEIEFVPVRDRSQLATVLQAGPAHAVVLNVPAGEEVWPLLEATSAELPGTPVIVCSVPRTIERAISLGALGHLVKPVTRTDLKETLRATGRPVRRVLLVDDDGEVLELFRQMLLLCDPELEIAAASSGAEALAELRHQTPDLMLLDVVMPGIDGWQVLEAMAQDPALSGVSTFVVSAQDPADHPPLSRFFLATIDEGLSLGRLMRCSLAVSALLLSPEGALDRAPG